MSSWNLEKTGIKLSGDSGRHQVGASYAWIRQVRPEPADSSEALVYRVRKKGHFDRLQSID